MEIDGGRANHPSIALSVSAISSTNQDFLGNKNQIEKVVNLCQDVEVMQVLKKYQNDSSVWKSANRWKALGLRQKESTCQQMADLQVAKWCVPIDFVRLEEFDSFAHMDLLCQQLDSLSNYGGSTEDMV